jgi:hypothetical protein
VACGADWVAVTAGKVDEPELSSVVVDVLPVVVSVAELAVVAWLDVPLDACAWWASWTARPATPPTPTTTIPTVT